MKQPDHRKIVDPITLERARELRSEMTKAEVSLWFGLRNRRALYKFRRQHPFGPYILDFYCSKISLAVEVDGWSHDQTATHDARRTAYLESKGVKIVRVTNLDVLNHFEATLDGIFILCEQRASELGVPGEE